MVSKYGDGKTRTQKCKSCSYDQVLYSSGVHISENGSVKVYDNEDAFHCPNCDEQDTPEVQNAIENDDPFEVLQELSEKDDSLEMQDTTMGGTYQ